MNANPPGAVLVAGGPSPLSSAIVGLLTQESVNLLTAESISRNGLEVAMVGAPAIHGLVIVLPEPQLGIGVLDVTDDMLEVSTVQCVDLIQAMGLGAAELADGGSIVVLGSRGHLGGWGGAHEMAFAGAAVGLMRSVALAHIRRGVRANIIALEMQGPKADQLADVAQLAYDLLSPRAGLISGQVILANSGRSLLLREAKDRGRPATALS